MNAIIEIFSTLRSRYFLYPVFLPCVVTLFLDPGNATGFVDFKSYDIFRQSLILVLLGHVTIALSIIAFATDIRDRISEKGKSLTTKSVLVLFLFIVWFIVYFLSAFVVYLEQYNIFAGLAVVFMCAISSGLYVWSLPNGRRV